MIPEINRYFPRLDFDGNTMIDVAFGNDFRPVTSHAFVATLNKAWGAHALKGGAEIRVYGERSRSTGNDQSGRYQFTNTYTRQNSASGTDYFGLQNYAAFLLGLPSTTSLTRAAVYDERSVTSGFFVQDDWRISDKLTINLGLRYEVETPLSERDNQSVSGFEYDYVQPIQGTVQANYAALNDPALKAIIPQLYVKGGLKFVGVDDDQLYTAPKNSFLPRVGFAYQVTPGTVVRGGMGLFAGFLGERRGDVITTGYSQTTTIPTTFNANGAPIPISWENALLSTPILEPVGNAQGRQTALGQGISFFNPNPAVSKQLRWQIGVQQQLRGNWTAEAVYVGNYGYDIEITRNINALPSQFLNADNSRTAAMNANNTFLSASVANPFAGLLPGTSFNNATIARRQLMRPYPAFGDINTTNNDGKSWYSSAQLGLQKRFVKGYTLGVSYTWSKWEQATEYLNATDVDPTRMISDLDVTNRLAISGIYELPFGQGKRFLSRREHRDGRAARRLADPGRLHVPDRVPRRVRDRRVLQRHRSRQWLGHCVRPDEHVQVDQHRRLHVGAQRHVDQRDAGRPPAVAASEIPGCPQGRHQQRRPLAPQERQAPQPDGASGEVRVHQRLQRALLPGPGHGHDERDIRAGHGVEPGKLRPPRAGRREAAVLEGHTMPAPRRSGAGRSFASPWRYRLSR